MAVLTGLVLKTDTLHRTQLMRHLLVLRSLSVSAFASKEFLQIVHQLRTIAALLHVNLEMWDACQMP